MIGTFLLGPQGCQPPEATVGLACSIFLMLIMGWEGTCGRRPGFCCSCLHPLWSPLLHPGPIGAHLQVLSSEICPKLQSVKILASLPTWDASSHTPMHGTIKHISRTCVLTEGSVCPARHLQLPCSVPKAPFSAPHSLQVHSLATPTIPALTHPLPAAPG